jgi:hypothetical protein
VSVRCPHCGGELDRTELAASLLTTPGPELIERVRAFVTVNEPATRQTVRAGLNGTDGAIDAALEALEQAGGVHRDQSGGYRTSRAPDVARSVFVGGPCPDQSRCRYRHRRANGPWTCDSCHPRIDGGPAA